MRGQSWTLVFVLLYGLAPFAWNLWTLWRWPDDRATVSETIVDVSTAHPVLLALIAFLMGAALAHLTWPVVPPKP